MRLYDPAWLALREEPAIEPALPIVDPHHHLWERPGDVYMVDELQADLAMGHNVVATVYVEASSFYRADGTPHLASLGETETVAALVPDSPIAGIVGTADLRLGAAVGDVLDAHIAAANGALKGIRHRLAWDPHPGIRANRGTEQGEVTLPEFRDGLRELAARDLAFDAWLFFPQLPELTATANAVPEAKIVLDHLGVAPIGTTAYPVDDPAHLAQWRRDLTDLARCPNVVLKVGGIGMVRYGAWEPGELPPSSDELLGRWGDSIRFAIDSFGPHRTMFESNFPVDKEGCSYAVLWNAFKLVSAQYGPSERARLFSGTAIDVYRLGIDPGGEEEALP